MATKKNDKARCGVILHAWRINHGRDRKGAGQFTRSEEHPCYLRPRHDGEHRCWSRDQLHDDISPWRK